MSHDQHVSAGATTLRAFAQSTSLHTNFSSLSLGCTETRVFMTPPLPHIATRTPPAYTQTPLNTHLARIIAGRPMQEHLPHVQKGECWRNSAASSCILYQERASNFCDTCAFGASSHIVMFLRTSERCTPCFGSLFHVLLQANELYFQLSLCHEI